jgi:hypothetical protein
LIHNLFSGEGEDLAFGERARGGVKQWDRGGVLHVPARTSIPTVPAVVCTVCSGTCLATRLDRESGEGGWTLLVLVLLLPFSEGGCCLRAGGSSTNAGLVLRAGTSGATAFPDDCDVVGMRKESPSCIMLSAVLFLALSVSGGVFSASASARDTAPPSWAESMTGVVVGTVGCRGGVEGGWLGKWASKKLVQD